MNFIPGQILVNTKTRTVLMYNSATSVEVDRDKALYLPCSETESLKYKVLAEKQDIVVYKDIATDARNFRVKTYCTIEITQPFVYQKILLYAKNENIDMSTAANELLDISDKKDNCNELKELFKSFGLFIQKAKQFTRTIFTI